MYNWRNEINEVLIKIETGLANLDILMNQYNLVSNNTNSLHDTCQQIVLEQVIKNFRDCEVKKSKIFY